MKCYDCGKEMEVAHFGLPEIDRRELGLGNLEPAVLCPTCWQLRMRKHGWDSNVNPNLDAAMRLHENAMKERKVG